VNTPLNVYTPYSLIHIILMFSMWSGNHKFYIQFLRLLRLQTFIITLYEVTEERIYQNFLYIWPSFTHSFSKIKIIIWHQKLLKGYNQEFRDNNRKHSHDAEIGVIIGNKYNHIVAYPCVANTLHLIVEYRSYLRCS
jgi:hypothetical protein